MPLKPPPDKAPEITAYDAGYLVSANGGWRSVRPIIDDNLCVKCMQCYLYCPDGAISPKIKIDYDFCKGCGICAKICGRDAVSIVKEVENA